MSDNLKDNGRYKIINMLASGRGFECYAALDISTSEHNQVVLNCYSQGDIIRNMVPRYYDLEKSGFIDYVGCFTEKGVFSGVFNLIVGEPISDDFEKNDMDVAERVDYTESLLHKALENAMMSEYMQCSILDNILLIPKKHEICYNYCIYPEITNLDVISRISDLLELFLQRKWNATDEQIDFLDKIKSNEFSNISAIYSHWRNINQKILSDIEKGNLIGKGIRYLKRRIKNLKKK